LTVADEEAFLAEIAEEPNLPEFVKQRLPVLY
jgi:hypothetical protein